MDQYSAKMSSREEALDLCVFIAKERKFKCVPKRKFKFAAITTVALVVGVVVGGPRGLAVGAAAAAVGAAMLSGKGKPLDEFLRNDLTQKQKEQLADAVSIVVRREIQGDFSNLVERVVEEAYFEELIVQEMKTFLKFIDMSIDY